MVFFIFYDLWVWGVFEMRKIVELLGILIVIVSNVIKMFEKKSFCCKSIDIRDWWFVFVFIIDFGK